MTVTSIAMLYTGSFGILVLISIIHGLSFTFFPVVMTIPFELEGIRPREIAVAMGFLRTAMMLGAVLGPVITGALHEGTGDLRVALTIVGVAALSLTLSALALSSRWDQRPLESVAEAA